MLKKDKILAAAMEEFTEKEYSKASTNAIMERAGASKGLLFHYFGNKEKLFVACMRIVLDHYEIYMFNELKKDNEDFFTLILYFYHTQVKWMQEHESYGKLFFNFQNAGLGLGIEEFIKVIQEYMEKMFGKLLSYCDLSLFRRDIPRDFMFRHMMQVSTLLSVSLYREHFFEKPEASYKEKLAAGEEISKQLPYIVEILRHGVYGR